MHYAKRRLLICGVMSFLFAGSALAQSHGRLDAIFQPWNAERRGDEVPGNFSPPELRGRAQPESISRSSPPIDQMGVSNRAYRLEDSRRGLVDYSTNEPAGTIVIDTPNTVLYLVIGNGKAIRYEIGVGREGFTWAGRKKITRMAEWPDWRPPAEMVERDPQLPRFMAGGLNNPLGARALYLGDTLYRIHGTNQPTSIGTFESSGCIRMLNDDVIDLYQRVSVGTQVVVLGHNGAAPRSLRRRSER